MSSAARTISSRWKRWRHNFDQASKNSPGRGSFCALPAQIFQQLPQLGLAGEAQPLLDAQGVADLVNSACNPYQEGVSAADLSIRNG